MITSRRAFFGLIGGAGASAAGLAGCLPPPPAAGMSDAWEQRAAQLEASGGVATTQAEGKWPGKAATHVPTVEVDAATGTVKVSSSHPMTEAHWLTTMYVRDQDGIVIHLVELVVRGPGAATAATTSFSLPAGTRAITAYTYCNLHDAWSSPVVTV